MNLLEKAKSLPTTPGVYLMKDSSQQIIYVGKSKSLKNRVSSYFQSSRNHPKKVERMVKHLKNFDYILTDTEFEALMLECKLIKEIQPMYNRMMKTTKAYPYIVFRWRHGIYHIEVTNQKNHEDIHYYFGPFPSRRSVENIVDSLLEFYQINCSHPKSGSGSSPCLNYSLNRCIGICFKSSAREVYQDILHHIIGLFKGTDEKVITELTQSMNEAANTLNFEKAGEVQNILEALGSLVKKETVVDFTKANRSIIIGEKLETGKVKVFFIQGPKILARSIYEVDSCISKKVKQDIQANFFEKRTTIYDLQKDDLDYGHIIYRYLTSDKSSSMIISHDYLDEKNRDELNEEIHLFISNLLVRKVEMSE